MGFIPSRSAATSGIGATPEERALAGAPWFFREAGALEALKSKVLRRVLANRPPDVPLRIWVAGGALAEDAYGLAIAIHEYSADRGEPPPPLKIFGTDADDAVIELARKGRFTSAVATGFSPERLAAYFAEDGGQYRVQTNIRGSCVFARHDLVREPVLSRMQVVSCRNVLGHLSKDQRERLAAAFHFAIGQHGILLVGRDEVAHELPGFTPIDETNGIFERLAGQRGALAFITPGRGTDPGETTRAPATQTDSAGARVLDQAPPSASGELATRRSSEELAGISGYAETIMNTMREGVAVLEPDLQIRSANRPFLKLFDLVARQVGGRTLAALGVEVLAKPSLLAGLRSLGPGDCFAGHRLTQRGSGPHGEQRSFVASARRLKSTELLLLTIDDVTVAEAAQAAVRRAELDFRRVLHEADEAIILADATGQPFFANRAADELFGYCSDELLVCSLNQLLPELDIERDEAARARAQSGQPHRNMLGRRKDGTEFPARIVVTSTARDRRPVSVVFVTDVTREREAEQARLDFQEQLASLAFDAALTEERERRRIALELHDRLGQSLALAQLKLGSAREDVPGELKMAVQAAVGLVEQAVAEVRSLMFDLSPPILYELGLPDAISWLAEDIESRHGLHVCVVDEGVPKRLGDVTSGVVFRAARELLLNVVKHAGTQRAQITLRCKDNRLELEVLDEGSGFVPTRVPAANSRGFGLLSVRHQLSRLAGLLEIESAPGRGTRAVIRVPLESEA